MQWLSQTNQNDQLTYALSNNSCDIWLCQATNVMDKIDYFYSILSEQEQRRALNYKFDIHRKHFIVSHGFTRCVLGYYLKIAPSQINFQKSAYGKPFIFPVKNINLKFNLSHTQDVSILALTKNVEVGIDIEYQNRKTDWQGITQRFFTDSEQQGLFSLEKKQQKRAFYTLWTRKEAYMKVLGTGLSLPPTGFSLTVPPSPATLIEHHYNKFFPNQKIEFSDIVLPESLLDYCATCAIVGKKMECRYISFTA